MKCKVGFILLTLVVWTNSKPLVLNGKQSNNLFCTVCVDAVDMAKMIFGSNIIQECLPQFIEYMCEMLKIQDHMICKGIISDFKDEFLYVLDELLKEPSAVCGLLDVDCDDSGINPLNVNWSLAIPPNKPSHNQRLPPKIRQKESLRVMHISDIHIDLNYVVGSEVKCSEPQCCRMPKASQVGQVDGKITQSAGYWGSVGNCDMPVWTLESMLKFASETHDQIDYIVISGDLESHAVWEYSKEEHQQSIKKIFDLFKKYFPSTKLYFSLGNHEGVPINNVAPHFVPERFHMDWLYKSLDDSFGSWLSVDERKTLTYNGCYMVKVAQNLRLLALNNIFGDNENFYLFLNQTDPDGAMTWLSNQLVDAEKAGDKVQILAHIPGGDGEMFQSWAMNYYRLVNRFEDTIVAQFFGHTHSELFYLTFEDPNDSRSRATSVIYSAPSVTTYTDFNPAYRIYSIDGDRRGTTYKVIDWEEWYLNLDKANAKPGGIDAPWTKMYESVKAQYQMRYLEPNDWYQLAQRFLKNDQTLQVYVGIRNRRFNTFCDHRCQQDVVCSIYSAQRDRSGLCANLDINIENENKWSTRKLKKIQTKIQMAKYKLIKSSLHKLIRQQKTGQHDKECPIDI